MKRLIRWIRQDDRIERLEKAVTELEKLTHPEIKGTVEEMRVSDLPPIQVSPITDHPGGYYDLGQRIRMVRHSLGLTQLQFANKIGKNGHEQVAQWETDEKMPTVVSILKICEVGGVSPNWLLTGKD